MIIKITSAFIKVRKKRFLDNLNLASLFQVDALLFKRNPGLGRVDCGLEMMETNKYFNAGGRLHHSLHSKQPCPYPPHHYC